MPSKNVLLSTGLLMLRVAFGCLMMVHGMQKLMGFSEMADKFPDPLGMGSQFSLVAAIGAEVGCSLLLILGLATRLATLPLMFTMVIALVVVHGSDPWKVKELAAAYLCVYLTLLLTGAGNFSLDHLFFGRDRSIEPEPQDAAT
ncbi:DoxX family protein [Crateriforma conspicua]|uniref:DoxX n=1 Tax=Crateriforma conspicua TaxID=2527996 RepID=A0A5C5YA98_9PLAN|nr:DoxX family protein [Crateriforma conspicua]TWT71753.1 DoxX [Crateriforma conspicua]